MDNVTAFQSRMLKNQINENAALRRENAQLRNINEQLKSDNLELKKVLFIALGDNLGGRPVVISAERFDETIPAFYLDENCGGDLLIKAINRRRR